MSIDQLSGSTSSLARLDALIRRAESKTKGEALRTELTTNAERRKKSLEATLAAKSAFDQQAPQIRIELDKCKEDMDKVDEYVKTVSRMQKGMNKEERHEVEELILKSKQEVNDRENELQARYKELAQQLADARKEERLAAMAHDNSIQQAKRLDMYNQSQSEEEINQLATLVLGTGPRGQLTILFHEVDANKKDYASLNRDQQRAQLAVWMGKLRYIQSQFADGLDEGESETQEDGLRQRELIGMLKQLSNYYQPGYVEALKKEWFPEYGWLAYVEDATNELARLMEPALTSR